MEDKSKKIKQLSLRQGAIKILINSIYGAFGNQWFYFYNPDIAQSITLQGQDMIKFANKAIDFYFKNRWHLDTELHEKLGLSGLNINKISTDEIIAIYTDTDSTYVNFGPAINSIEGIDHLTQDEKIKLVIELDENRVAGFYDDAFEKWSARYNTENRQTFKLENISTNGIWIKKKNYALNVVYEPNPKKELFSESEKFLLIKGLEPIKSSYPIWARDHQTEFIKYLLKTGKDVDLEKDLIPKLEKVWKEFLTLEPDQVAQNFSIRTYDKYVQSEEKGTLKKGATTYPKAVIYHNHLVIKHGLEGKYPKLRQGNKIRLIYCEPGELEHEVFAYNPGDFPKEIAPNIDRKKHFFVLIVEPVNRLLKAIGLNTIDENLKRSYEFKTSKTKNPLTDKQLYPYHIVNSETLEHEEVPEKFWKYIGNTEIEVPEDIFDEYLNIITKHGLNTVIVINKNLKPYKNRIAKKLGIELENADSK
jgi:DNA polymerase elongation subunit (family B)